MFMDKSIKNYYKKISSIMIKDHLKLLSLLYEFDLSLKNHLDLQIKTFNIFYHNLKKHFETEDEVLFSSFTEKELDSKNFINKLLKQHEEIVNEVEIISYNINNNLGLDALKLRDLLNEHLEFEEKFVYNKLDKIIDSSKTNELLDKLSDQLGLLY